MNKKSIEAKLALAESFVELAEVMPLDSVTINMVVDQVGKHRKTFYYHFSDKNQLIIWLFRYELANELLKEFGSERLVYQSVEGDFPQFPFYLRNADDGRQIYNAPSFDAMYRCLERRRRYYRCVFSKIGPGTLEHYLLNLYQPVLADDIRFLLEGSLREHSDIARAAIRERIDRRYSLDFLAEFFTGAFVSRFIQRLNYASTGRTAEDISPFENVIHDSMDLIIHQEVLRASMECANVSPAGCEDDAPGTER